MYTDTHPKFGGTKMGCISNLSREEGRHASGDRAPQEGLSECVQSLALGEGMGRLIT